MFSVEDLHHDYLLVCKMKSPIKIKARLLTELFGKSENPWRVVGITRSALNVFFDNGFNTVPNMKINRSHIVPRIESYTRMLEEIFIEPQSWWAYYFDNDKTILSTSSENMSNSSSEIFPIDNDDYLFKSKGYSWSYGKKEKEFLQKLYSDKLTSANGKVCLDQPIKKAT